MKVDFERQRSVWLSEQEVKIKKLTQDFELQLVDCRNNGNIMEIKEQRDVAFDKILELDKHIEDLVCKHCKELKLAHLQIWELKEKL